MKLYKPSKQYLDTLCETEPFIPQSNNLIGTIIRMNGFIYFIPIEQNDSSDYQNNGKPRSSSIIVLRMIDSQTKKLIGRCNFANMFPIPYKDIIPVNPINSHEEKQLSFIKANELRIGKNAKRLYKQKIKQYSQPYLEKTVDFQKAELFSLAYEKEHYGKHFNRFPDSFYFLTNEKESGLSEYYLMNQNTTVAKILWNNSSNTCVDILESIHPEYAPLECLKNNSIDKIRISQWFHGRGIPSWRDGLDDFLDNMGIKKKDVLLNKAFGLSLNDQYWMNPVDMQMDWHEINFFQHDFSSRDYLIASFDNHPVDSENTDLYTPNNTSDGMLKKAWIIDHDTRYLLKGTYKNIGYEPLCEYLASLLCDALSINHVDYSIEIYNGSLLSKCPCFVTENTEYINAYSILHYSEINVDKENPEEIFHKYSHILKEHGIKEPEQKLAKMYLLDYLIVNKDRHLGNFGIIRDVVTLKWIDAAPVFDNGQSMYTQYKLYSYDFDNPTGTFFNEKNIEFSKILSIINPYLSEIPFDMLNQCADQWKTILHQYAEFVNLDSVQIESLYQGLLTRIKQLDSHMKLTQEA